LAYSPTDKWTFRVGAGTFYGEAAPGSSYPSHESVQRLACAWDELAREALGWDYDIDGHCHNQLDLASAIKVGRAVEAVMRVFLISE
jgi:hypothetical protein